MDESTPTLLVFAAFIVGLLMLFFALLAFAGPRTREEREIATLITRNNNLQRLIDQDKREMQRMRHLIDNTHKAA